MTTLNHFQLIGRVRSAPRQPFEGSHFAKVKLIDIGSPVEQIYSLRLAGEMVQEAEWMQPGVLVYAESKLKLDLWNHPHTGDKLATLQMHARYVNKPPAVARRRAKESTDDPIVGTVAYITFDDDRCTLAVQGNDESYGLRLAGEVVHHLIDLYAGDQVVVEPGHSQPSVERRGDVTFVRLDDDRVALERRWEEERESMAFNRMSVIGVLKHPPRSERVEGRDVSILTVLDGENMYTVYTYDEQAREAQLLEQGSTVFVSGVLSLEDNRSGIGLRYRLRIDAFSVGDPANHREATQAIEAVARRSWGDELSAEVFL
jgi:single-stranded DNA-binding protein